MNGEETPMWGSFGLLVDDILFLQERSALEVVGKRGELMRIRPGIVKAASIVW
jgi:hypothetical protein